MPDTEVKEQTGQEQQTEHQETVKQNQTLEQMVTEAKAEADSKPEGDRKGQSINQRISSYANRAKEAEARATEEATKRQEAEGKLSEMGNDLQSLRAEMQSIKEQLAKGNISQPEATRQLADAKDAFQKALDDVELPYELHPYRDHLSKMATQIARGIVDAELKPFREAEAQRQREAWDREVQTVEGELHGFYSESVTAYPELFETAKEGELPDLKPEYQEEAAKILEAFNVPWRDKDGSEKVYNSLLSSKEGLDMLFGTLYRRVDASKRAKETILQTNRKVEQAKKLRVESPESVPGASVNSGPRSLLDVVTETVKEFS